MLSMYYDIAKYVATNVADVSVDWKFENGELDIDIHIKIPLANMLEDTSNKAKSSG